MPRGATPWRQRAFAHFSGGATFGREFWRETGIFALVRNGPEGGKDFEASPSEVGTGTSQSFSTATCLRGI